MPPRKLREKREQPALTVADLCQAIEARRVPFTVQNGIYLLKRADVLRLLDDEAIVRSARGLMRRRHAS
jgi:hypothetical protein